MGTPFVDIYNRFLGKITDDMYIELTPLDTAKDLRNLLIEAIPYFEFPRVNLYDYSLQQSEKKNDEIADTDIVIGNFDSDIVTSTVEEATFAVELSQEEINILAVLMKIGWLQRQINSIEVTRMKYSGPDFRMTSQANHLAKLVLLLRETQHESIHLQRLYKRRKIDDSGKYVSNWSAFREVSAIGND